MDRAEGGQAPRLAVIGLGVGQRLVDGMVERGLPAPVAICDTDPAVLSAVGARYPDTSRYDDWRAMIDQTAADIVVVASPDPLHREMTEAALDSGAHVFCEKPLCLDLEELQAVAAALARNPGRRLSSNLILRRSPRFLDLKARMDAGEFGRPFYVEGDYDFGRIWKLTDGWRGRIPRYSVTLGGGLHLIDLILWLTGERIEQARAVGSRLMTEGTGFREPDFVVALLTTRSGMVIKISSNFGCARPHFHRLMVYGANATFENGPDAARIFRGRDPNTPPVLLDTPYPGIDKAALLVEFADACAGRGVPCPDETEVFEAMAVGLAIDQSLREDATVSVDSFRVGPAAPMQARGVA